MISSENKDDETKITRNEMIVFLITNLTSEYRASI